MITIKTITILNILEKCGVYIEGGNKVVRLFFFPNFPNLHVVNLACQSMLLLCQLFYIFLYRPTSSIVW